MLRQKYNKKSKKFSLFFPFSDEKLHTNYIVMQLNDQQTKFCVELIFLFKENVSKTFLVWVFQRFPLTSHCMYYFYLFVIYRWISQNQRLPSAAQVYNLRTQHETTFNSDYA